MPFQYCTYTAQRAIGRRVNDKNMSKKDMELASQVLMGGALISIILSAIGYLGTDIWLASTQWLLVAAVLALFGVYARTGK